MSDCTWLSDRLPALPVEPAEWPLEDQRHLSGCESCRSEWQLVHATRRIGDRRLPEFDAGSAADALRARLRKDRPVRASQVRVWIVAGMAAAAALGAVLLTGDQPDPLPQPRPEPVATGFLIPLPELDGLQPAELDTVLRTMDQAPETDLNLESDLVLESWEG